jgi:hypothetical protein
MADVGVILKNFESPDETRNFQLGTFELVRISGITIGRATYQPGWRWSQHVGPSLGLTRCPVEHVGLVLSGTATAALMMGPSLSYGLVSCSTYLRRHTTVG